MQRLSVLLLFLLAIQSRGEVLKNGGFESLSDWTCPGFQCTLTAASYSGLAAIVASGRTQTGDGPRQNVVVTPGKQYLVSVYMKLLNNQIGVVGQKLQVTVKFDFSDGTVNNVLGAVHTRATVADGWIKVIGRFTVPNRVLIQTLICFEMPHPSVSFAVDQASVVELDACGALQNAESVINSIRKSNINIYVTTATCVNRPDIQIQVTQTKKSFPFGTSVGDSPYNDIAAGGKYRDFIHTHFNWAVTENALKWELIERTQGVKNYQPALDMVNGLRSRGVKVRGHTLVWSVPENIQAWVKLLQGQQLRDTVAGHITEKMNRTRGLLEHWDVNNENLHGTWYQDRLGDPSYNLELFRIARRNDADIKLFLNDHSVVASDASTSRYRLQGLQFKNADVGLNGMGAQCHFLSELEPNPALIKQRLDTLADVGVPIWATELDVGAADENVRADYYEKALKSLYGHPAVQGILMWGFWDLQHWRGLNAALVKGVNLTLTAAGVRVLDLLENQWMTRGTFTLTKAVQPITVRGFHGDYEVKVTYRGTQLPALTKTFVLGQTTQSVNITVTCS